MKGNAIIGQFGGPTSVINSSLYYYYLFILIYS
jgi:hypothetical protein